MEQNPEITIKDELDALLEYHLQFASKIEHTPGWENRDILLVEKGIIMMLEFVLNRLK
ncbi:hypothetical protein NZD89_27950 (plasmid) [Alicyclobacillus fastidiosus]|uniref:Uncharacterized protein n=1 Tax=Alicyclobacillus fastidiosus TaxID=392011 RepID=A0ABY6ZQK5_9BACL|nr:hypothetical protein [Alicyclobacillus fastidiosus]WAH44883.1 hypothetical protein NZD89_27950 [Alicyclobacillus fastidiosus]GMA65641.1 hypothetical protein GCM10025859_60810 [Alicyclobacillus fastidiosus]GMA65860.1 hypothetical protein GCM10025859_63000 [Alicyclobacillus fastidiosus]